MEKNVDLKETLPVLKANMSLLQGKLEGQLEIEKNEIFFESGAWVNDNGVAVGYLSCLRKPSDELVDLTIDLQYLGDSVKGSFGVYWPNNRLVKEIADVEFSCRNTDELISQLGDFFTSNNLKALETLTGLVRNIKDEPN